MKNSPLNQSNPDFNNKIYYDESKEQDMSEEDVANLDEDRNSEFTQERSNDMQFDRDFAKLQAINKTKPVMLYDASFGDGAQDLPDPAGMPNRMKLGSVLGSTAAQSAVSGMIKGGVITAKTPFEMSCWKGYKAKGKKKSPSGKKTKSGKIKMVNNCVKK